MQLETLLEKATPATRKALLNRLNEPPVLVPQYFDEPTFRRLQQVCDRLIPQSDQQPRKGLTGDAQSLRGFVDIAGPIDQRLANGTTNGWRYDDLPNDGEAYRLFLMGLDQTAEALFTRSFNALTGEQQDTVLQAVQQGDAPGPAWQQLPGDRVFEELLAEVVEVYYSHPLVQLGIGYTGMVEDRNLIS